MKKNSAASWDRWDKRILTATISLLHAELRAHKIKLLLTRKISQERSLSDLILLDAAISEELLLQFDEYVP